MGTVCCLDNKTQANVLIRILDSKEEVEQACKILYICLIEKPLLKWDIGKDNASQITIAYNNNNEKILTDKFTYQASWFAAFINNQMVGCCRGIEINCSSTNNYHKLEMEYYPSFPKEFSQKIKDISADYSYRVEGNRLCVLHKWRNMGIRKALWTFTCQYLLNKNGIGIHSVSLQYKQVLSLPQGTSKNCMKLKFKELSSSFWFMYYIRTNNHSRFSR